MAKFKCIHTNNVYEFKDEETIKKMREHSEYKEVEEPKEEKKKSKDDK
jgi:hypothetical protein